MRRNEEEKNDFEKVNLKLNKKKATFVIVNNKNIADLHKQLDIIFGK